MLSEKHEVTRRISRRIRCCTLLLLTGFISAWAQTIPIKGVVQDSKGDIIPGATIVQKDNQTNGTATNLDGLFELNVPVGSSVIVSFIGMKSEEVAISGQEFMTIVLYEDTEALEEVVVVGYGTQKKESVVGSIHSVQPSELKVPSSNLSTAFAGKLAGVISVQRSGEPGADGASFWIRGISTFGGSTTPLIVVDGVEVSTGDLNTIDPEVIESFSILKDATATALYGSRGANGVMIVVTKSGRDQDRPTINFRTEVLMNQPIKIPQIADGVTYMQMYNEAVDARNASYVKYSNDKIQGTIENRDPFVYPNINWYNEMFRETAINENFNLNVRGGSRKLDYFMSVSVNHETGMIKNKSKDYGFSYDTDIHVWRYVFQNNLNINLSEGSKLSLKLNTQLRDWSGPATGVSDLFSLTKEQNGVDFPIMFPDSEDVEYYRWGGKNGGHYNASFRNPMALLATGYSSNFQSTVIATLGYNQKLDFITKGLSFDGLISFKNWTSTSVSRSAGYNQFQITSYQLNAEGGYDYTLNRVGTEQDVTMGYGYGSTGDRKWYIQLMLNYGRTFNDIHHLSAMLLYNQEEYDLNAPGSFESSLPERKQGIAGRVTYDFDSRYLIEFNFGYNGSENFAPGHRFGFFPSVAAGYVISNEAFWKGNIVNHMKIRGSYGLVGNDQTSGSRFLYMSNIDLYGTGYATGYDGNYSQYGPVYNRYGNADITWETGYKTNLGLDLQLADGMINLVVDVFNEDRKGIFMTQTTVPNFLGTGNTTIYGNLGEVVNKGGDLSLNINKQFGHDWHLSVQGTFTYAHNEVKVYEEPPYREYPNLSRVGHSVNSILGYKAERLFIDETEIAASPEQLVGTNIRPGDIKYSDLPNANGEYDGQITTNDRTFIGNPTVPEIVYGFGASAQYKGLDFSVFFQGAARTSFTMSGHQPFGGRYALNVLQFIADDYYKVSDPNIYAAYPRLCIDSDSDTNNRQTSTYWLRDGSFLKFKNAEIGYSFKLFRVYARGTNLFTFSKFKLWDPEQGGGAGFSYPTQRTVNVGVQMTINK